MKIEPLTSFTFPTSEQGIIFPYVADSKIRDYLVATAEILGDPKYIIAASRISKNRVSVFLNSSEMVDNFLSRPNGIKIRNEVIRGRHLKNKPKKLILSNVSPTIPNSTLERYLTEELKLKLTSKISLLRVNPADDIFGHVISYRRQVYVAEAVEDELPGSFLLTDNESTHRIFITYDELTCFKCKSRKHKAEDCSVFPEHPSQHMENSNTTGEHDRRTTTELKTVTSDIPELTFTKTPAFPTDKININVDAYSRVITQDYQQEHDHIDESLDSSNTSSQNADINLEENPIYMGTSSTHMETENTPTRQKRALQSNSSTNGYEAQKNNVKKKAKPDTKLTKISTTNSDRTLLPTEQKSNISQILEQNPEQIPPNITSDDIMELLTDILNTPTKNASTILSNYSRNTSEILSFLTFLQPEIKNGGLKNRLTRIIKQFSSDTLSNSSAEEDTTT